MSQEDLTALIGLHNGSFLDTCREFLERFGYKVDVVSYSEEMIEMASRNSYQRILMDLNLGSPGSVDITPAVEVYNLVKSRVESRATKFIGISGNDVTIEAAVTQGIPAEDKLTFSIVKFLKE